MEREIIEQEIELRAETIIPFPKDKYYTKEEVDGLLDDKADETVVDGIMVDINNIEEEMSGLQEEITINNKLSSDLVDDTNKTNKFVTSAEKTTWNNKSDFSGDYNDLSNKPTIPTVPTNVSAFTNDAGYTTNTGTITSIKMNGSTISTSGEADLGTVIIDISGKQDTLVSGTNIKTINNESVLGAGNIAISGGSSMSYDSGTSFELSGKNPGVYTLADGSRYVKIYYNNVDKTGNIKLFNNTIYVYKSYSSASDGEIFAMYLPMTFDYDVDNGNYFIKNVGITYVKKYNNNVLIEDGTKWNFKYASLTDNSTISGLYTFNTLPQSSVAPISNNDLVNKSYVDGLVGNINTVLATLTTVSGGGN